MIYVIDKSLSIQHQALVLRGEDGQIKHFPYSQTFQMLKFLATEGELYFNEKSIVIDLFGRAQFYYLVKTVDGKNDVQGFIKTSSQEFPLSSCDFICGGPPHWFIKGFSLKFLSTSLSYRDFKGAFEGSIRSAHELEEEARSEPDAPRLVFFENSRLILLQEQDPLPILVLKDRSGAFADLWMDYHAGNDKWVAFHRPHELPINRRKRHVESEKLWEKDLLETGYIKKIVDTTHYYCSLDQVAKSLAFLLELGWQVFDYQKNRVVRHTHVDLRAESADRFITVKGKIQFDTFQADISKVAGAFNRRERFVQLGSGVVGLLPAQWEHQALDQLIEDASIVGETLRLNKGRFLSDLMEGSSLTLDTSLNALKDKLQSFKQIEASSPGKDFIGHLRPYQQQGLNWLSFLYENGFHGMLADDMGLGKTVQVLAFLSRLELNSQVLIVVPTSLIFNWHREIARFIPKWPVTIHHGCRRSKVLGVEPGIILTSYSTLRLDLPLFLEKEFNCAILDEAQAIKNPHTQIFQAIKKLQSRFRLEMTGTPVENHLQELWAHFHFLIPELFGNETAFAAEIQASGSDSRFLSRIKKKIKPFLLRRKKEEVAQDLPEKIEQIIWLEMGEKQRGVYDAFLSGFRGNLIKKVEQEGMAKHRMEILEAILRLRQICCHPLLVTAQQAEPCLESAKLEMLMQDLETIQEEGRKALIYSQFTSMLGLISQALTKKNRPYAYLDGNTLNREKVVDEFQQNPSLSFFLISLKAGGVGLNLTAADYVFLYDPWWNESIENQAIGRAHRIGRKETVIAKKYVMIETIEEKMMKLKAAKKALAADLIEGEGDSQFNEEDLMFLLL